jgi:SAM-dependent methyltransferase
MVDSWKNWSQMTSWLPDRWEAPDRKFFGHRDIVIQSLARYRFVAPYVHGALLDVGCGRGYGLEALTPNSTLQVGIDISKEFLAEAKTQCPAQVLACGNGDSLPLKNGLFDSVIAFEVIEHAENDLYFLEELKRVARKDAFVVLSTPNRIISSGKSLKPLDHFHVREYDASEFYRLLKNSFSSVQMFGQIERVEEQSATSRLVDRIPIRWKYLVPHLMQTIISVALRPPLRLKDCQFRTSDLEQSPTFLALCRR